MTPRFNVTAPMKVRKFAALKAGLARNTMLQCDRTDEGAEITTAWGKAMPDCQLQCDRTDEGAEILSLLSSVSQSSVASM